MRIPREKRLPLFRKPRLLLHPMIPPPLAGVSPRAVLGTEWWDVERRKAYAKNNFCCWACGEDPSCGRFPSRLEGHEVYRIDYQRGKMYYRGAVALDRWCHLFIHRGFMRWKMEMGAIPVDEVVRILERGERILRKSNLRRSPPPVYEVEWEKWSLVLGGKEYRVEDVIKIGVGGEFS